ncbi:hypothetical protein CHUAL_002504 [Chamberlinius hualienensis]
MMDKRKLIIEVKKRPAIWDKKCLDHRNRPVMAEQWTEVSKVLHCSVSECKRTWKSAYDHFRALYKNSKYEKKEGKLESITPIKWIFYKPLTFLVSSIEYQNDGSNTEAEMGWEDTTEATPTELILEVSDEEESGVVETVDEPNSLLDKAEPGTNKERPSRADSISTGLSECKTKNGNLIVKSKRRAQYDSQEEDSNMFNQELFKSNRDTDISPFGLYITHLMKEMPEKKRQRTEQQIINIIYDALQ